MIPSHHHRFPYAELIAMVGQYQELIEDEKKEARRSLHGAKEADDPVLRTSRLDSSGCHVQTAMRRHTHQRELLRMVHQKDAFCSFKVGSMVYAISNDKLKAHGVVIGITPNYVRIYITHSNLTFFDGVIDVPRDKVLDCWEFEDR